MKEEKGYFSVSAADWGERPPRLSVDGPTSGPAEARYFLAVWYQPDGSVQGASSLGPGHDPRPLLRSLVRKLHRHLVQDRGLTPLEAVLILSEPVKDLMLEVMGVRPGPGGGS